MQKKYDFEIDDFDLEKFGEKRASLHCVGPETSADVRRYLADMWFIFRWYFAQRGENILLKLTL